jgi:two-component system, chemotaxis family, chemotaxis protein CheY
MLFSILIVDDSAVIRSAVGRVLQIAKIPVETLYQAENGVKALEILNEKWVDLVITDIHMPEMGGIELIDNMKNRADLKDTPVIVISTEGNAARIEDLASKGVGGYLRKPFTPEEVIKELKNVLGEWNG